MEKKYKLLKNDYINILTTRLYRIQALRNFNDVKKGDLGGYIEKEENLSHSDNAWIGDNAKVSGNAKVYDNATVLGNSDISDNAKIHGFAIIVDSHVYNNANVSEFTIITNKSYVHDNAKIYGHARIINAQIFNNSEIYTSATVANCVIRGNAIIEDINDFIVFKNWWSSGRFFTWTRSNNMWSVGCFYGTGKELIEKAYKDSKRSGEHYAEIVEYVEKHVLNNNSYSDTKSWTAFDSGKIEEIKIALLQLEKEHHISFSEEMKWLDNLKLRIDTYNEFISNLNKSKLI